ncbi:MAG: hypothetical protein MHM6MM_001956 [Cercozoa sp. M6MM]
MATSRLLKLLCTVLAIRSTGASITMSNDIDAAKAVSSGWCEPFPVTWNRRDLILYALGIGATELPLVYENHEDFAPFPTYPIVLEFKGDSQDVVGFPSEAMAKATFPGQPQPAGAVLDGERYLEVLTPLPQDSGVDMRLKVRMNSITDKGKYAVVERESVVFCAKTGKEFVRMFSSTIFVGVTGFQSAGEPFFKKISFPDRAPDATVEEKVSETQTQIYRLSGDYNPLHICPDTAKAFGFPAPILHGLCTFGHSARHVIQKFAGNDARRLRSVRVRFSKPVLPGQTLRTEMWRADDASRVVFRTVVKETGAVVMTNCEATLQTADDSAAAPTSFQSEAVFQQMQARLTPTIMGKVQAVFRFVVKNGPVTR